MNTFMVEGGRGFRVRMEVMTKSEETSLAARFEGYVLYALSWDASLRWRMPRVPECFYCSHDNSLAQP